MKLRWASFAEFLADRAARGGDRPALSLFGASWEHRSFREVKERAEARARALLRSGHAPGDRVALLSNTSLELAEEFLGVVLAGAIAVPLDPKLSLGELAAILGHLEPRSLIVAPEFLATGAELRALSPFDKLLLLNKAPTASLIPEAEAPLPARDPEETAAIFYTSGTLGSAKGVMVNARAILAELTILTSFRENSESDVIFSILPLNHLYGVTAGLLYSLACGSEYVFAHSLKPEEISRCLNDRRVTQMNVVPLLLNLMRRGIQQRIADEPPARRQMIEACLAIGPYLPLFVRRRIFKAIHAKLGGRLRGAVSGAAPLDPATFRFFRAIGAPIYEGYGLTETGPVISVNHPGRARASSAGQPLPGLEVKIHDPDPAGRGEICTRGPHLMQGYFRAPELTANVMDADGWFHTGDLGRLDRGYLRITGRLKALIVLPSGKKVQAEEVERALGQSRHLQDVCVVGVPQGDRAELVVAVVYPSETFAAGIPDREKEVEREALRVCRDLSAFKQPSRVIVRAKPFEKTSSGKVKRHLVLAEVLGK